MKAQIEKYFVQQSTLPRSLKGSLEAQNEFVRFYALSDIDESKKLTQYWVVLTQNKLHIFDEDKNSIDLTSIGSIKEIKGRTFGKLIIFDKNQKLMTKIVYSKRQYLCFMHLKYLIEQDLLGNKIVVEDCDKVYQETLVKKLIQVQGSGMTDQRRVVWRLLSYLKPYRNELALGGLGALLATVVALVPAYISGRLIDSIIKPFQNGELSQENALNNAFVLVGILAFAYISREVFIWLRLKKMSILGEKVAKDLRVQLYSHLQKLELDFYSTKQTGSIISRVSSDTDRIWDFIAFGVVEVGISVLTLLGLSVVLITLDWKLGILMTIPVPILIFAIFKHGQKMQNLFLKAWRKWSDLTDVLSDTISGMQVVKSFGKEKVEEKRFNNKNTIVVDQFNSIHEAWTKFWPILMFAIHFVILFVWLMAMPRLISLPGEDGFMTAGTFVAFLLYMTMFSAPIEVIGQMARMLNRATSSAYRIFEILDTQPTMINGSRMATNLEGKIQFKNVHFSYDGVRDVLNDINLDINAGEMIGLVGASGSGKSTITKLVSRFYDVYAGEVSIDGINVKEFECASLRSQIGVVLQDPYLFHGSIVDNIRYGKPEATLDEVLKAARIACAHEFIIKFQDGYETVIGERGQTLSGGERQRISIARAIINDPKILILDEATSAVDTKTERNIQKALDNIIKGRTVIAIAHRLSTLRSANKILVVKDGEIIEKGTHQELMQIGGEYKVLQDMQAEMHQLMQGKEKEDYHEVH